MAIAGIIMMVASVPLWLLVIRPYARTHGAGRVTGANLAVAAWADCQQAREIAESRGETGMIAACRVFVLLAGGGPALMLLGMLGAAAD